MIGGGRKGTIKDGEVREWELETQGDVGGPGKIGISNTGQGMKDLYCFQNEVYSFIDRSKNRPEKMCRYHRVWLCCVGISE